jgi:N-ethylmaleimide reductase
VRSQYFALADELSNIGLLYMHVLDHSAMGAPPVSERFKGAFFLAGGFNKESAEKAPQGNHADLIAFGTPFLANDAATFYVPGPKGHADYPTLA